MSTQKFDPNVHSTITRNEKKKKEQPKCPSIDEQINKIFQTTEYYLLIKKKKEWSTDTHHNTDEPQKHAK